MKRGFKYVSLFILLLPFFLVACQNKAREKVTGEEISQIRGAIESYIKKESSVEDSSYIYEINDPEQDKLLSLTYDHVHEGVEEKPESGVRTSHKGKYFACVDFVDKGGTVYDVDVYVVKEGDGWKVSDVILHKVGKENRLKE